MFLTFLRESIRFSTVFLYGSTGETITQKADTSISVLPV